MDTPEYGEYVGAQEFAETVGFSKYSVRKVAKTAGIRTREIPGLPIRFHKGDVLALAAKVAKESGPPPKPALRRSKPKTASV